MFVRICDFVNLVFKVHCISCVHIISAWQHDIAMCCFFKELYKYLINTYLRMCIHTCIDTLYIYACIHACAYEDTYILFVLIHLYTWAGND